MRLHQYISLKPRSIQPKVFPMNKIKITPALVLLLLPFALFGCSSSSSLATKNSTSGAAYFNVASSPDVLSKWSRSCALCHVTGEADAPISGDKSVWQGILAQGEEQVMQHVLEGYNSMPPLGYCMSCETDDFRAMIGFMAGITQ